VTAAGAQFGQPGYETDLLYLACLAALVLGGSGAFAVDGLLARKRPSAAARCDRTGEKLPEAVQAVRASAQTKPG
jgi:hypothetical protein